MFADMLYDLHVLCEDHQANSDKVESLESLYSMMLIKPFNHSAVAQVTNPTLCDCQKT